MNVDNSNKSQAGSYSNSSLEEQLEFLKQKNMIKKYITRKYGYPGMRKGQFKCDFNIVFQSGEEWILFSAASLTSDRLKTKQWDAENIRAIDSKVTRAYVVCPDSSKSRENIERYRGYIRTGLDKSYVDDILFHSEFVSLVENQQLGTNLAGRKAAKKGINFESLIVSILQNEQNLARWKGDMLQAGFQYYVFEMVMEKLALNPADVKSLHASNDIPNLPKFTYRDGSTKRGGPPKTDVVLRVEFVDGKENTYTFSCKTTTKKDITVFQFPPKYCVEVLGIIEPDVEQLLDDYTKAGGPEKITSEHTALLTERLSAYAGKFNRWALHGSDADGSTAEQRADYIIIRYQKKDGDQIIVQTVDECIQSQIQGGRGHFGTAYGWTVTSKTYHKDGTYEQFPALRICAGIDME